MKLPSGREVTGYAGSPDKRPGRPTIVGVPGAPHVLLAAAAPPVHLHLTWFQTVVLGVLQGVSELFPVSSLGHIVLLPSLFGWHQVVAVQSDPESSWLAFVVMLHVGSALGLLVYFWRDWVAIVKPGSTPS